MTTTTIPLSTSHEKSLGLTVGTEFKIPTRPVLDPATAELIKMKVLFDGKPAKWNAWFFAIDSLVKNRTVPAIWRYPNYINSVQGTPRHVLNSTISKLEAALGRTTAYWTDDEFQTAMENLTRIFVLQYAKAEQKALAIAGQIGSFKWKGLPNPKVNKQGETIGTMLSRWENMNTLLDSYIRMCYYSDPTAVTKVEFSDHKKFKLLWKKNFSDAMQDRIIRKIKEENPPRTVAQAIQYLRAYHVKYELEKLKEKIEDSIEDGTKYKSNDKRNSYCNQCDRPGHTWKTCWNNPDNPKNRLKDNKYNNKNDKSRKDSSQHSGNVSEKRSQNEKNENQKNNRFDNSRGKYQSKYKNNNHRNYNRNYNKRQANQLQAEDDNENRDESKDDDQTEDENEQQSQASMNQLQAQHWRNLDSQFHAKPKSSDENDHDTNDSYTIHNDNSGDESSKSNGNNKISRNSKSYKQQQRAQHKSARPTQHNTPQQQQHQHDSQHYQKHHDINHIVVDEDELLLNSVFTPDGSNEIQQAPLFERLPVEVKPDGFIPSVQSGDWRKKRAYQQQLEYQSRSQARFELSQQHNSNES